MIWIQTGSFILKSHGGSRAVVGEFFFLFSGKRSRKTSKLHTVGIAENMKKTSGTNINCGEALQQWALSNRSEDLHSHFFNSLFLLLRGTVTWNLTFIFPFQPFSDLEGVQRYGMLQFLGEHFKRSAAVSQGRSCTERVGGKRNKTWDVWEVEGIFKCWEQIEVGGFGDLRYSTTFCEFLACDKSSGD